MPNTETRSRRDDFLESTDRMAARKTLDGRGGPPDGGGPRPPATNGSLGGQPGDDRTWPAADTLADIASTLRAQLSGTNGGAVDAAGGLGARIDARRSQIVGARGPVSLERVKAALQRGPTGVQVPASTADLPSRQQLLTQLVTPAAVSAQSVLDGLTPVRSGAVDSAEVTAVVTALGSVLVTVRAEAQSRDPRQELVEARVLELSDLFPRLRRLMLPRRNDRFGSREDLEQANRLRLLERHLTTIVEAYDDFFDPEDPTTPAVDRVGDVQDGLRVVGDAQVALRARLARMGVGDADLAAPEARLWWIEASLPRMTMGRLLEWVAELAGGREAADLPTTGEIGLQGVARQAERLAEILGDVNEAVNGSDEDPDWPDDTDQPSEDQEEATDEATDGATDDVITEPVVVITEDEDGIEVIEDTVVGEVLVGGVGSPGEASSGPGRRAKGPVAIALSDSLVRRALEALQAQLEIVATTAGGTR